MGDLTAENRDLFGLFVIAERTENVAARTCGTDGQSCGLNWVLWMALFPPSIDPLGRKAGEFGQHSYYEVPVPGLYVSRFWQKTSPPEVARRSRQQEDVITMLAACTAVKYRLLHLQHDAPTQARDAALPSSLPLATNKSFRTA